MQDFSFTGFTLESRVYEIIKSEAAGKWIVKKNYLTIKKILIVPGADAGDLLYDVGAEELRSPLNLFESIADAVEECDFRNKQQPHTMKIIEPE